MAHVTPDMLAAYYGSRQLNAIYHGSTLIWPIATGPRPSTISLEDGWPQFSARVVGGPEPLSTPMPVWSLPINRDISFQPITSAGALASGDTHEFWLVDEKDVNKSRVGEFIAGDAIASGRGALASTGGRWTFPIGHGPVVGDLTRVMVGADSSSGNAYEWALIEWAEETATPKRLPWKEPFTGPNSMDPLELAKPQHGKTRPVAGQNNTLPIALSVTISISRSHGWVAAPETKATGAPNGVLALNYDYDHPGKSLQWWFEMAYQGRWYYCMPPTDAVYGQDNQGGVFAYGGQVTGPNIIELGYRGGVGIGTTGSYLYLASTDLLLKNIDSDNKLPNWVNQGIRMVRDKHMSIPPGWSFSDIPEFIIRDR